MRLPCLVCPHPPLLTGTTLTCREVEAVSYTYLRREWQILDQGVAGDFQQVCLPLSRVSESDHAAPVKGCSLHT